MSLNKYSFIFLNCFIGVIMSLGQEVTIDKRDSLTSTKLDDVVITATRTERQLSSLPLPVTLINRKQIEQINSARLSEVLNEQTGLITIPDFGGVEGIQLQGLDSQYTLILLDGMPLIGRSAGSLDINRVSVGNIKQIEIVKGPSSSLYGSEALGGVVNIITEEPTNGFKGNLGYRVSTFNTHDASTNLNYKKNKFGVSAFFNRFSSDGYKLEDSQSLNTVDPYANYTSNLNLTYDFSDKTQVLLSGRYYHQTQKYNPTSELSGKTNTKEWNTHLKLNHTYNKKWSSFFEVYASQYYAEEYTNDLDGNRVDDSDFDQKIIRPEIRGIFKPNTNNTFMAGLGYNYETLNRTFFDETPEYKSPYLYFQYESKPFAKTNVIIGARYDMHNAYKDQLSPKAAIHYQLLKKIALKASVGYGYKAPDFRQLYFNFTNSSVGYTVLGYNTVSTILPQMQAQGQIKDLYVDPSKFNNSLEAESSVGLNIGIDYNKNPKLKLSINAFKNNIKNLIDLIITAQKTNGQNVFSYQNLYKVYTQGIEVNAMYKPTSNLSISGGYQYLIAKDKEAESKFNNGEVYARINGEVYQLGKNDYVGLLNRSKHMANFKIFYTYKPWNINANIRGTYRSKYGLYDTNDNNYLDKYDEFVEGYTTWDFALNKTLYSKYIVGFGIDNIFNFKNTQNISNIPGRIIYGKININL